MNKIKSFINSNKILSLTFLIIIVFTITTIFLLWYIKPSINTDFVENDFDQNLNDIEYDNGSASLKYNGTLLIKINGNDYTSTNEFNLSKETLNNGFNTITIQRVADYGLFQLVSKEVEEYNIYADLENPKLKLNSEIDDYYVLTNINIKFSASKEISEVFVTSNDETKSIDFTDNGDNNYQVNITPQDGQNSLELFVQDKYGIKSKTERIEFQAFMKDGYSRFECNDIVLPINDDLRFGISLEDTLRHITSYRNISQDTKNDIIERVQKTNQAPCQDGEIDYLYPKDKAFLQCYNCGGPAIIRYPIKMTKEEEYYNELPDRYDQLIEEDILENPQGNAINFYQGKDKVSRFEEDFFYIYIYYFTHKGQQYSLNFSNFSDVNAKQIQYLNEIAKNMKFDPN